MDERKLQIWWASLTILQKERIANKVINAKADEPMKEVRYPECSNVWNELPIERKHAIYEHCTDEHGMLLHKWREGRSFSY